MPELEMHSDVQYMKGVGPRRAAVLAQIGIKTAGDLLNYLPRRYIDRSDIVPIGSLKANMNVTIIGRVMGKGILMGRKKRLEVVIADDTGHIALIWFTGYRYLEKLFNKGEIYAVTGQVTYFQQHQIVHPEVERIEEDTDRLIHTGCIVPVYPSTAELKKAGITGRIMRQLISRALESLSGKIKDNLPGKYLTEYDLMKLPDAIKQIHYPENMDSKKAARSRLAFDELLELQFLILNARKKRRSVAREHLYDKPGNLLKSFTKALPFRLTDDQKGVIGKIIDDMQSEKPMHRLLQGDVGCGKTVVAILAALYAAENSYQSAIMAPTEILAEQHYHNWREPLDAIGVDSVLLTGSLKKKERNIIIDKLIDGAAMIAFGTHAVISESVKFKNLGLVVIDEQHRFGVMQRGKLMKKGIFPDTLVMSATPIPRTLAMTLYGDLDISSIKTLPPGRRPTRTVWRTANSRPEMYKYIKGKLDKSEQVFIIYPLVEKSEKIELQAAEDEYKILKNDIFKEYSVGLVHGRTKKDVREKTINAFRNNKLDILVATTVIEVGIDIPSASVMVIEHAERFGLSQLHQLRGRVGRGKNPGMVIAVAIPPISDLAKKRLDMFAETSDGFKIAEADLSLRGPGEFFGTRQHGLPELTVANLVTDIEHLPITRRITANLLITDKSLDRDDRNLLSFLNRRSKNRREFSRIG